MINIERASLWHAGKSIQPGMKFYTATIAHSKFPSSSVIEFHKYKTLKWFALKSEKNQFTVAVEKSVCQAKQVASW